jgi:hypothetical protein
MKCTEITNVKCSKYLMCKSTQPAKVRWCIFPVLACLLLCEHLLSYILVLIIGFCILLRVIFYYLQLIYFSVYFHLLKLFSYSAPWLVVNVLLKGKANHLIIVLQLIWKFICNFTWTWFVVSSVNTIMKDAAHIKELWTLSFI